MPMTSASRRDSAGATPRRVRPAAGVGLEVTGDDVDEGGLARTVVADQTELLAALDRDRNIAGGDHGAEGFLQTDGFEERGHSGFSADTRAGLAPPERRRSASEPSPPGRNRMISKRKTPSAPCQVFGKYWLEKERTNSRRMAATNTAVTLTYP